MKNLLNGNIVVRKAYWELISVSGNYINHFFDNSGNDNCIFSHKKLKSIAYNIVNIPAVEYKIDFIGWEPTIHPALPLLYEYLINSGRNIYLSVNISFNLSNNYYCQILNLLNSNNIQINFNIIPDFIDIKNILTMIALTNEGKYNLEVRIANIEGVNKNYKIVVNTIEKLKKELNYDFRCITINDKNEYGQLIHCGFIKNITDTVNNTNSMLVSYAPIYINSNGEYEESINEIIIDDAEDDIISNGNNHFSNYYEIYKENISKIAWYQSPLANPSQNEPGIRNYILSNLDIDKSYINSYDIKYAPVSLINEKIISPDMAADIYNWLDNKSDKDIFIRSLRKSFECNTRVVKDFSMRDKYIQDYCNSAENLTETNMHISAQNEAIDYIDTESKNTLYLLDDKNNLAINELEKAIKENNVHKIEIEFVDGYRNIFKTLDHYIFDYKPNFRIKLYDAKDVIVLCEYFKNINNGYSISLYEYGNDVYIQATSDNLWYELETVNCATNILSVIIWADNYNDLITVLDFLVMCNKPNVEIIIFTNLNGTRINKLSNYCSNNIFANFELISSCNIHEKFKLWNQASSKATGKYLYYCDCSNPEEFFILPELYNVCINSDSDIICIIENEINFEVNVWYDYIVNSRDFNFDTFGKAFKKSFLGKKGLAFVNNSFIKESRFCLMALYHAKKIDVVGLNIKIKRKLQHLSYDIVNELISDMEWLYKFRQFHLQNLDTEIWDNFLLSLSQYWFPALNDSMRNDMVNGYELVEAIDIKRINNDFLWLIIINLAQQYHFYSNYNYKIYNENILGEVAKKNIDDHNIEHVESTVKKQIINPDLSVIMVVSGVSNYISSTLKDILSQNYNNFELILIDNTNDIETQTILTTWATSYDNIRLFKMIKREKISRCLNFAIENAKGDYIIFLDSSGKCKNSYFATAINLIRYNRSDLVIFSTEITNESDARIALYEISNATSCIKDILCFLFNDEIDSSIYGKVFSKELIDRFNKFHNPEYEYEKLFLMNAIHKSTNIRLEKFLAYSYQPKMNELANYDDISMLCDSSIQIYKKIQEICDKYDSRFITKLNKDATYFIKTHLQNILLPAMKYIHGVPKAEDIFKAKTRQLTTIPNVIKAIVEILAQISPLDEGDNDEDKFSNELISKLLRHRVVIVSKQEMQKNIDNNTTLQLFEFVQDYLLVRIQSNTNCNLTEVRLVSLMDRNDAIDVIGIVNNCEIIPGIFDKNENITLSTDKDIKFIIEFNSEFLSQINYFICRKSFLKKVVNDDLLSDGEILDVSNLVFKSAKLVGFIENSISYYS